MNPDDILNAIAENPITAGIVGTALATVVGFFKPIAKALQRAFVRRIDQAWVEENAENDHEARVRKTATRVKQQTIMPLTQSFVEERVRKHKSNPPPPTDE